MLLLLALAALARPPAADTTIASIVGGTTAEEGRWPDAAAVLDRWGDQVCSGTLIAPTVVLTAGHCADEADSVRIGRVDYEDPDAEAIVASSVEEYPDSWGTYDLALMILASPSAHPPRRLALDCELDALADGVRVILVGFGATDEWGSAYGSVLQEGGSRVVDAACTTHASCFEAVSPGGELYIGGDGADACFGDSGGPLYLPTDDGERLVGVASRKIDSQAPPCDRGTVYVRPDAVVDWIEETAGVTLERPACEDPNGPPEPTAEPLEVEAGGTGSTLVLPNDPDPGDAHAFAVLTPPEHGTAVVTAEGELRYTAGETPVSDAVVVMITDDADPPLWATVTVAVTVVEASPDTGAPAPAVGTRTAIPRGCAVAPLAPGPPGILALFLLRRRRRPIYGTPGTRGASMLSTGAPPPRTRRGG